MVADTITIQVLPHEDLARIGEVDRTERITSIYRVVDGQLQAEEVDIHVPRWKLEGDGPHSVGALIRTWRPILEHSGLLLGALAGEQLAGFAMLRYRLSPTTAQLALLFVSKPFRRQRVGARLLAEVEQLARAGGATELYVSSAPSASTVSFYTRHGFQLTSDPNEDLFRMEPEDIHMIKRL